MKYWLLIGRILFAFIFLMTVRAHFSSATIEYAAQKGVPLANVLVPLSAVIAFAGGLSIATGYKAKFGTLLIVLFLVPVTYYMHAFWKEADPMMQQMQMANFMKNLALTGAALIINYFGSGPLSLDNYISDMNKTVVKGFKKE
jgi:putative oxidoreductase